MYLNTRAATTSSRHYSRAWFVLLAFAALVLLAACGGGTTTTGNTPTTAPAGNSPTASNAGPSVMITTSSGSFAFSPLSLTIKVGMKVTWTNTTGTGHTVTSDDGKTFDSGLSTPISASGGTYSFTFTKAGTFNYHCQFHPFMKATIIVLQ